MKRKSWKTALLAASIGWASAANAGQVETGASAASQGRGPGTASGTAGYDGNGVGFTQTEAHSGRINFGRGLAFGVDENGLSLSSSYAVAGPMGPAVAGTFNATLGFNGEVATSYGRSVAEGDRSRSVSAGGSAGSLGGPATAQATASGQTGPRGEVRVLSRSRQQPRGSGRFGTGLGRRNARFGYGERRTGHREIRARRHVRRVAYRRVQPSLRPRH